MAADTLFVQVLKEKWLELSTSNLWIWNVLPALVCMLIWLHRLCPHPIVEGIEQCCDLSVCLSSKCVIVAVHHALQSTDAIWQLLCELRTCSISIVCPCWTPLVGRYCFAGWCLVVWCVYVQSLRSFYEHGRVRHCQRRDNADTRYSQCAVCVTPCVCSTNVCVSELSYDKSSLCFMSCEIWSIIKVI